MAFKWVDIDEVESLPRNPKLHANNEIDASLGEFGYLDPVIINETTGHLLGGHGRMDTLRKRRDLNRPAPKGIREREYGKWEVEAYIVEVPEDKEESAALALNNLTVKGGWDEDMLTEVLIDIQKANPDLIRKAGFTEVDVAFFMDAYPRNKNGDEPAEEGKEAPLDTPDEIDLGIGNIPVKSGVPDAIWPTDNDWGIPVLLMDHMADALDLPVNRWGTSGRREKMRGTYHFYTDDYRFEGLWDDPTSIIASQCINVIETNFSTNPQMPRAVVLWHIYRKRWLSRYWQSFGVKIFVDLGVNPSFMDLNLLGVPYGWKAYGCYMFPSHNPEPLEYYVEVARERADSNDFLLAVVGGDDDVQKQAQKHPQCVWVQSFYQSFYQNVNQKTAGK